MPTYLSDPQWLLIQPLFSPAASRGRPASDKRSILEGIFWKLVQDQAWYDIPGESPSWQTCYQYYHRWHRTPLWKALIITLITDLASRGGLDLFKAWERQEIKFTRNPNGGYHFQGPPHLAGTWQLTTAHLILVLLAKDRLK